MNEQEIIPENEDQADELLSQIEEPSHAPIADEDPKAQQAAPQAPVDEFTLTVGGKEIKAKRDKILKWAQMGYDAPTRIGSLTKEIESWKQKESQFKEIESRYKPIDEYVKQNPQFWNHVLQQWENRNQQLNDQSNPLATTVQQLQQEMQDLKSYKEQVEQQRQQAQMAREDEALTKEIEEIRTKYPQIDFNTPDETGKSLEYKVIEHANENGIRKFATAFKDFYHDQLVKLEAEKAKESVVKERQKNSKLGILGKTDTPTRKLSDDVRGKSYGDLTREIIEEFNLS